VAGAGAMALVYRAEDLKLGRSVALKVLRPELAEALGRERFLNEVDIAARLVHPNILPLHDVCVADGLLYYVMPYVEGESLRARLAREGPLKVGEAVRIAREVAEALAYAHGRGIVHRDIKPANILLLADHAVVSDFGVARAIGATIDDPAFVSATGTPAYMSPEQASGSPDVDGRSDLYSLGCVLYEMLTGAPPDGATDPAAVLATRPGLSVPAAAPVPEPVPGPIVAALSVALAKNPVDRFSTAAEFAAALKSKAPSRLGARKTLVQLAAAAAAAVILLAVAAAVREVAQPLTITSRVPQRVTFDRGRELEPGISPDRRKVAGIADDGALRVQSLAGGAARNLSDAADREGRTMEITRRGSQPSGKGPGEWFTGTVRIDPLFRAHEPARAAGVSVTFEPGSRTAWHTHPLGQTLIVTAGAGLAQRWGGPIEEIRPGDVVWFPPGEKHWHGASPTTAMTHISLQEQLDGKAVRWLEKVSDEQYQAYLEQVSE